MRLLVIIGIPVRFLFFVFINIALGLLDPPALKRNENDWRWVLTGEDAYQRSKGRQLI